MDYNQFGQVDKQGEFASEQSPLDVILCSGLIVVFMIHQTLMVHIISEKIMYTVHLQNFESQFAP